MHAELSLAEISPAVRLDSLKHHCCRKCIHEGAVEDRGGPISVSSVIFDEMRTGPGVLLPLLYVLLNLVLS